jgi:aldose 1-epimerase
MSTTTEPGAGVTISSGPLDATFLPELGMLGSSFRHLGEDLLALPGGLDGYRAGRVTGLPLLAPWANRLGSLRYDVGGVVVDLGGLELTTDERGLPIHGTMTARPGWDVSAPSENSLTATFDFGGHPDLLASFPFPHVLRIEATVDATRLQLDTTLVPTGDRPVPISFGYHPYLCLPGERRADVRLRLPERRHLELDDRQLPTGRDHAEPAEDGPLGDRSFDDLYELGDDRRLALTGGPHRRRARGGLSPCPGVHAAGVRERLPRTDDGARECPRRRRLCARVSGHLVHRSVLLARRRRSLTPGASPHRPSRPGGRPVHPVGVMPPHPTACDDRHDGGGEVAARECARSHDDQAVPGHDQHRRP